ncbi:hypothetical protein KEM56_001422 [Ascosphaera pollenicola]|nr:hypothetical protein KEM56_001422 [Ascosphaera pollenicola]
MVETSIPTDVHKLRLINPGAMGTMKFSIDGHRLLVTALDMVPIHPYTTDHVVLSVGQRMEVLVRASRNPRDSYYMRAAQVGLPCGFSLNPNAKALILHEDAPDGTLPNQSHPHKMLGNEDFTCISQPLFGIGPLNPRQIAKPDITKRFLVTSQINATGHQNYAVNGSVFHANYNHPLLLQVNRGDLKFEPSSNVHDFGTHRVGRVIVESETEGPHGFYTNFLTHPQEIGKRKEIAKMMPQTCHAWEKWSGNHLVAEIDDGV